MHYCPVLALFPFYSVDLCGHSFPRAPVPVWMNCLDTMKDFLNGDRLEMAGSRFNIALGMASQSLFAKVVQIHKEKQKRPPVLWAC